MITLDPARELMILKFAGKIANRPASRFWSDPEKQVIAGRVVGYFESLLLGPGPFHESRVDPSLGELGMAQDITMEGDRGFDAFNSHFVKTANHAGNGLGAGWLVDDQLADHRIVVR